MNQELTRGKTPSLMRALRLASNPIIGPSMSGLVGDLGANINGPSLIRVPDWIEQPLGRYYLYFAHHLGHYIRLAYTDFLEGPWQIYAPGALSVDATACHDHIASPDVHINHDTQEIWMYFHGCYQGRDCNDQITMLAKSKDGLNFTALPDILGANYFRVFQYDRFYYAIANNWYGTLMNNRPVAGVLLRSEDGRTSFEMGPDFIPNLRHAAVWIKEDRLYLFYSRYNDIPERILMSCVDLNQDWQHWCPSDPVVVLEPEQNYEGADLPLQASEIGIADGPTRQLRDPAIYIEGEKLYILYSVAGEQGIAIAELNPHYL